MGRGDANSVRNDTWWLINSRCDDLADDVLDVERHLLNLSLVRERPHAPDHLTRPIVVVYYPFHRAARSALVGRVGGVVLVA
jgi:hypothetical protein